MKGQKYITQTQCWLKKVVIGLNFCPFAKREVDSGSVRYSIIEGTLSECLENLMQEVDILDAQTATETSLLIYPENFEKFDDFLDLIAYANDLLIEQGYEGVYQLANFHPNYCFNGVAQDDPANYTNRSPYPMLHLIREESLEKAVASHPNPESIPTINVALARKMGEEQLKKLLASCF